MKVSTDTQSVIKSIVKALRAQGNYTPELDMAILRAAGDLVNYTKTLQDLDSLESTYYKTRSREGNELLKIHPVVVALPTLSKAVNSSLKAIGLTLEALALEGDPLTELIAKVNAIGSDTE